MPHFTRSEVLAGIASLALALPTRVVAGGEIDWFSLVTEDVYGAIDFYSGLFGWEIISSPTGGFIALRDGRPFAAFNEIEDRLPGASESLWLPAIHVDDVAEAVRTARALGATIHEDVTELAGWGTFALIQDPQGAPLLAVNSARALGGTQSYSGWRWAELWTHDPDAAAVFYAQVVGYEMEDLPVGDRSYEIFHSSGKRDAGLVRLDRPEIAARWMPYVGVTDLRGILVRVWAEGGRVLREPSELDNAAAGADRVALIADPSGAALFLYQLAEQAVADPIIAADAATRDANAGSRMPNVQPSLGAVRAFGPGWDSAYPQYPHGPFGPRY